MISLREFCILQNNSVGYKVSEMQISQFIENQIGIQEHNQIKILITVLVILILWILRLIIVRIVWKHTEDVRRRYAWRTSLAYTFPFIGVMIIAVVWVEAVEKFSTFFGLMTAGLAIALKDPLTNFAGWLFIVFRKPFTVGDRIQIGEHSGDVIDVRLFQFTLLEIGNWVGADQSTGRIIHMPNGKVFSDSQANYSKGFQFIWNEIPVVVTFESDWEKAKLILNKIVKEEVEHLSKEAKERVQEASKNFLIYYSHLTPTIYTCVKESGVMLTMRYLCDPRKRRSTEHAIWECVLSEFENNHDISFAYPTQRFYQPEQNDFSEKKD